MPSLSKQVVHDYDPKSPFHNQAINIPLLSTWIDELISLTEKSLPVRSTPTTEQLVESLSRYDAVFRELMRQTGKYSTNITKMFAKTWMGTLNLMDYMVKSYHRYVTTTDHLQEQARELLKQRAAKDAANTIMKEEFELERTALRAQIRTLQAEVESIGATQRGLERENSSLRDIIDNYIKSAELSEQTWEILDDEGDSSARSADNDDEFQVLDEGNGRRKANYDATRKHLKNMNRLDIEINEAIVSVLKEEDRQRMLVSDLTLLMNKNKVRMEMYAENLGQRVIQDPPKVLTDAQVQVDMRADFGVVTVLTEEERQREWASDDYEEAPQVDFAPFSPQFLAVPFQIRTFMTTFPRVLRVPPIAWVMQSIFAIYMDKLDQDRHREEKNLPIVPMGPHVYDYFLRRYELHSVADNQMAQLVAALKYHFMSHKRVELFCHQMGIEVTDEAPGLDTRDTTFILDVLARLRARGELQPERAPAGVTKSLVFRKDVRRLEVMEIVPHIFGTWLEDGGMDIQHKIKAMPGDKVKGNKYIDIDNVLEIMVDVWYGVRITWEDHLHYLFHEFASTFTCLSDVQFAGDHGSFERDSVLVKVSKQSSTDCSRRPMRMIQRRDAIATNIGGNDPDLAAGSSGGHKSHIRPMQVGNPSKEAVCDILTEQDFEAVMLKINPYMDSDVIKEVYETAVEWGHAAIVALLERMWVKMTTPKQDGKGQKTYVPV